jgi:hypothetical protein
MKEVAFLSAGFAFAKAQATLSNPAKRRRKGGEEGVPLAFLPINN